jgi:hypothetical protein
MCALQRPRALQHCGGRAAVRSGERELAGLALERLAETTSAAPTDWALGIEARSRALLSDGDSADTLYREAIERLARTSIRLQLAGAHLLYGNGCGASAAAARPGSSSAPRSRCSRTWEPRDSRGGRCRSRKRSSRNADAPEIGCHQVTKAAREDRRLGRPMAIWVRIFQVDRHRPFEADWLVVRRQQPRAFLRHPRAQPATTAAAESRETVIFRRFLEPALPEPTVARFAHAAEGSSKQ